MDSESSEILGNDNVYTERELAALIGIPFQPEATRGNQASIHEARVCSTSKRSDNPDANKENLRPKRKRRRKSQPNLWYRNIQISKRQCGESYIGSKKTENGRSKEVRPPRMMGDRCGSHGRIKSYLCSSFSDYARNEIFQKFWTELTWAQRKVYIGTLLEVVPAQEVRVINSRRSNSFTYHLMKNGQKLRVCKKMLLSTLGIREWQARHWKLTEMSDTKTSSPENISKAQRTPRRSHLRAEDHQILDRFFAELPKLPSHYCRKETDKSYLEPIFRTNADVYRYYLGQCKDAGNSALSKCTFYTKFKDLNISVYHPKKDQCDICVSFKNGNVGKAEYDLHIARKELTRAEKDHDKGLGMAGKCHVFTMDVQSVKLAPYLQASSMYYKTKLCCHNFTIYDLTSKYTACYFWNESEGELVASTFATCIYSLLKTKYAGSKLPIVLFSDGCTYQNRNQILSNALSRLAAECKIEIYQKFLEKGHTQMECDSVHSTIERRLKGREIYLPTDYIGVIREARRDPEPYEVFYLDHKFFKDFSGKNTMMYDSIRPGNKSGDPVVTDLRVLKYSPVGKIFYKLSFSQDFKEMPRFQKSEVLENTIPSLYKNEIPISARKYKDLQELKQVIPKHCHAFYDNLLHK